MHNRVIVNNQHVLMPIFRH